MKRLQGLIAAAFITVLVALGMLVIGVNAVANANSVPVSDSPAQASTASTASTPKAASAPYLAEPLARAISPSDLRARPA